MCFYARRATTSRRRSPRRRRPAPTLPPLAMLDLSKPGERQAHDFLVRATRKRDSMWKLFSLTRQEDVLLCVVRWVHPNNAARPFSLAHLCLTEPAVYWRNYATIEEVQSELEGRCSNQVLSTGDNEKKIGC